AECDVLEEGFGERNLDRLLRRDEPRSPGGFSADRPAGKELSAVARNGAVNRIERAQLSRRETRRTVAVVGAARDVSGRAECAAPRIIDEPVLQSIGLVASRIDGIAKRFEL